MKLYFKYLSMLLKSQLQYKSSFIMMTLGQFLVSFTTFLSKKADQVSGELDKQMVNTEVSYNAPFDVNDTFAEVLGWYLEQNS